MTYKWIGAILVIAGCGGFGFSLAAGYQREEFRLRQMIRALQYMHSELQYHLTPLPELCRQAGMQASGAIREVFFNLARELDRQTSPDACTCMRSAIRQSRELSSRQRKLFLQLGQTLGHFDLPGQLRGIKSVCGGCKEEVKLLAQSRDARLRSYRTLGLCAGAALAILFA